MKKKFRTNLRREIEEIRISSQREKKEMETAIKRIEIEKANIERNIGEKERLLKEDLHVNYKLKNQKLSLG